MIVGIYGISIVKKMLKIEGKDFDFILIGYVLLLEVIWVSCNYLLMIINGCYIKNFVLNKVIVVGYGLKLMVGCFLIVVLEIEMDLLLVDVNVYFIK